MFRKLIIQLLLSIFVSSQYGFFAGIATLITLIAIAYLLRDRNFLYTLSTLAKSPPTILGKLKEAFVLWLWFAFSLYFALGYGYFYGVIALIDSSFLFFIIRKILRVIQALKDKQFNDAEEIRPSLNACYVLIKYVFLTPVAIYVSSQIGFFDGLATMGIGICLFLSMDGYPNIVRGVKRLIMIDCYITSWYLRQADRR